MLFEGTYFAVGVIEPDFAFSVNELIMYPRNHFLCDAQFNNFVVKSIGPGDTKDLTIVYECEKRAFFWFMMKVVTDVLSQAN